MVFNVFRSNIDLALQFMKLPTSLKSALESTMQQFPTVNRVSIDIKAWDKEDKELDINTVKMSLGSVLFEVLKGEK